MHFGVFRYLQDSSVSVFNASGYTQDHLAYNISLVFVDKCA